MCQSTRYPPSIQLYALEAKEVNPPLGQEPIHWRLMTTHRVGCIEQALQVLQWYCWRWRIEQLFATLKLAGLDIEATQLESVEAIQRLTILAVKCQLHRHINLRVFFSLLEWARSPLRNLKRRDRDFSETTTITLLY